MINKNKLNKLSSVTKLRRITIYMSIIILVIIDQITKICIIENLHNLPIEIINNFLIFNYCENTGVAFSIGNGNVPIFIILNIILIIILIIYYEKNIRLFNKLSQISFICVVAGGFSNLLDRIFRGFVVDFIDISNFFEFPVFNVADILVVFGIIGLVYYYISDFFK